MKIVFSALLGAFILTGCAVSSTNEGLREFDLRKPSYQYIDSDIRMDLSTVQRQLYIHREVCNVEVNFKKDPMQVHFATILYGPKGSTQLKDQVMLDLTAYATGKLGIKGYAYYIANKDLARDLVNVLENPLVCPEGIALNPNPNPYVGTTSSIRADSKKE